MKKSILGACFVILATCPLFMEAALPPLYQSLNEYRTLLESPELAQKLGSAESIRDVERTEGGFLIKTTHYTLSVDVVHDSQEQPGPTKFHLIFHDLERV